MLNIRFHHRIRIQALIFAGMTVLGGPALATTCVSFSSFPKSNVSAVRAKFTFSGTSERPIRSLAFNVTGSTYDVTAFATCQSAGINRSGDTLPANLNTIPVAEMSSLLTAAGTVPAVVTGGVSATPYLTFSLFDGTSASGFEVVLDQPTGITLLQAVRAALIADVPTWQNINIFGCVSDLKEPGTPTDVTNSVQVAISGVRLNRTTGRFVASVAAKNISASAILGPISVVFVIPGQVRLHTPTGNTCGISPEGYGYQNLALTNNSLAGGATVTFTLDLDNPALDPVAPTVKVYAGAGSR